MTEISCATPSQLEDILSLDRRFSPVFASLSSYQRLLQGGGLLLVETAQGAVRGFAAFSLVLDEASLLNLVVAGEQRRQGVARQLLHEAWRRLPLLGVRRVLLELRESNIPARQLYESEGFSHDTIRSAYYPTGNAARENALLMSRHLEI